MVKHKAHGLLDVFPKRPNQKVVDGQALLNSGRSTRSAGSKNLFTMCPYANTIVAYDSTKVETKTRSSYSPDPGNNMPTSSDGGVRSVNQLSKPVRSKSVMPKPVSKRPRARAPPSRAPSSPRSLRAADISGQSSPYTNNTPVRRRAASVAPAVALPKGLKIAKRFRSRAPALNNSSPTAPPAADMPGLSSPMEGSVPKGLLLVPPKSRPRATTSKYSSFVAAPPTRVAQDVPGSSSMIQSSPASMNNRALDDTPERIPIEPIASNIPKGFEKVVAQKRSRSRGPPSRVSSSLVTLSPLATIPSASSTVEPPTKIPRTSLVASANTVPAEASMTKISQKAPIPSSKPTQKAPANEHDVIPEVSQARRSRARSVAPTFNPAVVPKVSQARGSRARSVAPKSQPAVVPKVSKVQYARARSVAPTSEPDESPKVSRARGSRARSVAPTSEPDDVPKVSKVQYARARSVAPQALQQSPGRPPRAAGTTSVANKKVAKVASKTTRKRTVRNNNMRRRAPVMAEEPEEEQIVPDRDAPIPSKILFFPLNPVFTSTKDTSFKGVEFKPKLARNKELINAIIRERRHKAEEVKRRRHPVPPVDMNISSLYELQCLPVFVNGKIAIQYESDFSDQCRFIKNLACFHEEHESFVLPLLRLADWEIVNEVNEGNVEAFYKEEVIPAIENLRKFNENPSEFFDAHNGQFERHLEDGIIIEYPLPPKPEVFPSQIRKRTVLNIYNEVNRRNEARARREAQAAARAHDAAIEARRAAAAAAAAAAEIPMMHMHNHLDNLAAYHHQQMLNQMFMPQPFFYPPPPNPPMFPHPQNDMFYPGMHFPPPPMPYGPNYFNNGFPMHDFGL